MLRLVSKKTEGATKMQQADMNNYILHRLAVSFPRYFNRATIAFVRRL